MEAHKKSGCRVRVRYREVKYINQEQFVHISRTTQHKDNTCTIILERPVDSNDYQFIHINYKSVETSNTWIGCRYYKLCYNV